MNFMDAVLYSAMAAIAILVVGAALAGATWWITQAVHAGRNHCDHCLLAHRLEGPTTTVYTSDKER
jgi:hypothetical protein